MSWVLDTVNAIGVGVDVIVGINTVVCGCCPIMPDGSTCWDPIKPIINSRTPASILLRSMIGISDPGIVGKMLARLELSHCSEDTWKCESSVADASGRGEVYKSKLTGAAYVLGCVVSIAARLGRTAEGMADAVPEPEAVAMFESHPEGQSDCRPCPKGIGFAADVGDVLTGNLEYPMKVCGFEGKDEVDVGSFGCDDTSPILGVEISGTEHVEYAGAVPCVMAGRSAGGE
jgi:hypothetical protein